MWQIWSREATPISDEEEEEIGKGGPNMVIIVVRAPKNRGVTDWGCAGELLAIPEFWTMRPEVIVGCNGGVADAVLLLRLATTAW